jgi:GTP cyclohydrolase II
MLHEYSIIDKVLGVPLRSGDMDLLLGSYKLQCKDWISEHALLYKGEIQNPQDTILLRINSACYTSDIFHCSRCDCHWQLHKSIEFVSQQGGLIIYHFNQEGRGIGFTDKLKSYLVMDRCNKTTRDSFLDIGHNPDDRDYESAVFILKDLGIISVKLLRNNHSKTLALTMSSIDVIDTIPLINSSKHLRCYLMSKKEQFGHSISF